LLAEWLIIRTAIIDRTRPAKPWCSVSMSNERNKDFINHGWGAANIYFFVWKAISAMHSILEYISLGVLGAGVGLLPFWWPPYYFDWYEILWLFLGRRPVSQFRPYCLHSPRWLISHLVSWMHGLKILKDLLRQYLNHRLMIHR
jgi:hypothetical protein